MANPYEGVMKMSPAEQQQIVIDTLRQAQQRSQQLNPAVLAGLMADDKGMNRMAKQAADQMGDTQMDRELGGTVGRWAQGRQGNNESVLRAATSDKNARDRLDVQNQNAMDRLKISQSGANTRASSRNDAVLEAARLRASAKSRGTRKALPYTALKDLSDKSSAYKAMKSVIGTFKPEYTTKGPTAVGDVENYVQRQGGDIGRYLSKAVGLSDEHTAAQADWWQNYGRYFELGERNLLFGATLTDNEQKAWKQVEISKGMDPKDILKGLKHREKVMQDVFMRVSRGAASNYNNPETVSEITGLPMDKLFDQGAANAGAIDDLTNEYEDMSSEQLMEQLLNYGKQ